MKNIMLNLITERGDMTFVELAHEIKGFKGDNDVLLKDFENVLLWHHVSDEALEAIQELLKNEQVFLKPCSLVVYIAHRVQGLSDCITLSGKMSINPSKRYWLPAVLTIEPQI
jgi:hypothetical protein